MCKGVKSIVDKVVKAIKKVWDFIRKYLAIILFVIALVFPYVWPYLATYLPEGLVAAMKTFLATSQVWGPGAAAWSLTSIAIRGVVGLGFAYLLSSEAGKAIVDKVGDVVGDVVGGIGDVLGKGASSILSNPWVLAGLGIAAWMLLGDRENDQPSVVVTPAAVTSAEASADPPQADQRSAGTDEVDADPAPGVVAVPEEVAQLGDEFGEPSELQNGPQYDPWGDQDGYLAV